MVMTIEELADQIQTSAAQRRVRKFDIFGSTVDETSVQVDRGEPKQVKASNRSSVIVRVWNEDQRMGVTSTNDVTAEGLGLALEMASEASEFGVKEHVPDFSPEAAVPIPDLSIDKVPQAAAKDLLDRLVEAEDQLLQAHAAIKGVPYNGLAQRDIGRFYLNSNGAVRYEGHTVTSLFLVSRTEQEGKRPRSAGAIRLHYGLDQLDIAGCIQEAAEKTISHLDYQKISSGKYTVVFSADAFLSLLGAFSNLFNAQNILDKQSLSTPESLGTTLASPQLCLCDHARHPDRIAGIGFDGEGTPTRRVQLIENGVLTSFIHSSVTAKRMEMLPTGHGNVGAKVTVSPHFYEVYGGSPADQTYSLEDAEDVVFIDDLHALHAGVKATQGSFSLPFDGWVVNRGKKISIASATVAGDFRDLLQSILYVEPEPEVLPGGICPRIWVRGLSITGE